MVTAVLLPGACQTVPQKDKPDLPQVHQALQDWQTQGSGATITPPPVQNAFHQG